MEENTQNQNFPPDSERLLSMLAHFGTFLGGIILPLIIWATQKDKSQFVRFHSLQALFFQVTYIGILFLATGVFLILYLITIAGTFAQLGSENDFAESMPAVMIISIVLFYVVLFASIIFFTVYSIVVGIKSYKGELKKYPVIGNIVYRKVFGPGN